MSSTYLLTPLFNRFFHLLQIVRGDRTRKLYKCFSGHAFQYFRT